jgi:putative Holliday junction resolvase
MKYLGIDYGTKKIGLAVSDDNGTLAFPKGIIPADSHAIPYILDLIQEKSIDHIIVGESTHTDGQDNHLMRQIAKFVLQLEKATLIPIQMQQEWYSSVAARAPMYGKGNIANPKWTGQHNAQKREDIDDKAAAVILQRFLDKQQK